MLTTKFIYKLALTAATSILLNVEYVYYPYCIGSRDEPPSEEDISIESIKICGVEISDQLFDLVINSIAVAAWKDFRKEQDDSIIARAEYMRDSELEIFNLGK